MLLEICRHQMCTITDYCLDKQSHIFINTLSHNQSTNDSGITGVVTYLDSPICLLMVSHCEQLSPMMMLRGGYVYSTV